MSHTLHDSTAYPLISLILFIIFVALIFGLLFQLDWWPHHPTASYDPDDCLLSQRRCRKNGMWVAGPFSSREDAQRAAAAEKGQPPYAHRGHYYFYSASNVVGNNNASSFYRIVPHSIAQAWANLPARIGAMGVKNRQLQQQQQVPLTKRDSGSSLVTAAAHSG